MELVLEWAAGGTTGAPAVLRPAAGSSPVAAGAGVHRLTVEWHPAGLEKRGETGPAGVGEVRKDSRSDQGVGKASPESAAAGEVGEVAAGGDSVTIRRRLELILGGRPGFTTGAKAEVLADLLSEFGRPALLEAVRRDWITQFDTGPDSSTSVSRG